MFSTIAREYKYIRFFVKLLGRSKKLDKNKSLTVPDMIEESIDKFPNNIAIEFEDKSYTYLDLDKESNQVANWAIKKGYKTGDVVALLMENKPEFIFIWLGLSKLGITIACLNNNIKSKSLAHCIQTSKSKSLILSSDLIDNYSSAEDLIDNQLSVYVSGNKVQGFENIDDDNEKNTNRPNSSIRKTLTNSESLFYIYTSGTTGLPKASNFSHQKFAVGSGLQMFSLNMKSTDKTYLVLPLYHATGGVVGLGSTLFTGGTVVLRKKFSVEKFWEDCATYNVTVITYIGELFRYLISAPKNEFEKQHNIRGMYGNGLRPDVWKVVQDRFGINNIIEFYGASEGNVSLTNVDSRFGSIGRIPPYAKNALPTKIVKFDVVNEKVVRNEDGFCIECEDDEAGEVIGLIPNEDKFSGKFEGYTDKEATEKKILKDVFEKGDQWFSSGDLLKRDKDGYYYFVDRIGDTFRWKSENVATSEVSEAISTFTGVKEANVYGVLVPGEDGRAGMASIVPGEEFSINGLYEHLSQYLPKYSIPVFIRISKEIEVTGTFKYKKTDLVKDGFDPSVVKDQMYYASTSENDYIDLDVNIFKKISDHELKL
ncbi:MAG: long-chain-acyl-CoA synthetase [Pelagibacterales bacterium]|nr:long-chain-acyl-CoA synthetase [Pelagibacterales bacterium]